MATNYLGSKGAQCVYKTIIAAMPPHDHYYEPFLGTGQVMRHKWPVMVNRGWDMSESAVKRFQATSEAHHIGEVGDGFKAIESARNSVFDILLYLDPPYPLETRTSAARYDYDWPDTMHHKLMDAIKDHDAKIMLSTYPNKIYEKALTGWRYIDFPAPTRGSWRTERLYMNFPEGQLFSAAFAGHNKDHRQRVKRKVATAVKNYKNATEGERMAILGALINASCKVESEQSQTHANG